MTDPRPGEAPHHPSEELSSVPLFTQRHGLSTRPSAELWERRHISVDEFRFEYTEPRHRCDCPSFGESGPFHAAHCLQAVSQEDGLCDACRRYCHGVDGQGRRYLLRDHW